MKGLSPRQSAMLEFIGGYIAERGYPPSVRDIAAHFRLASAGGVHKHINALVRKGYLSKANHRSRSLRLLHGGLAAGSGEDLIDLPLAGYVAAGQPIESIPQTRETITMPLSLLGGRRGDYVLRVRGDSMVEESILDGDFVVLSAREHADNGETVVALVNGEATLKRFYVDDGRIRLQPANSAMAPIMAEPDAVRVQGVVVGVWRRY